MIGPAINSAMPYTDGALDDYRPVKAADRARTAALQGAAGQADHGAKDALRRVCFAIRRSSRGLAIFARPSPSTPATRAWRLLRELPPSSTAHRFYSEGIRSGI